MRAEIAQYIRASAPRWSAETIERYAWYLDHLCRWLEERGIRRAQDVSTEDLRAWLDQTGWRAATVHVAISAARGFFRWAVGDNRSPANELRRPPRRHRKHRWLEPKQIEAILGALDTSNIKGIRNTAVILLMLDTGLRASEVCRLRLRDLDLERRRLYVIVKGGNEEVAVFSPYTAGALESWLAYRPSVAARDVQELFVGIGGAKPGTPITRDGLRAIFRALGKRAGIHFSPHDLRRTCGTWILQQGGSTRVAQMLLRLKTLSLVETYSPGLSAEDARPYSPVNRIAVSIKDDESADTESRA